MTSMNRAAQRLRLGIDQTLTFRTQLTEQLHYGRLSWLFKFPARQVLGGIQQFFGFGHEPLALCEKGSTR